MERRSDKRRHLILFLRVFNDTTGDLLGYLGDINSDGMLIISDTPIGLDEPLSLRMQLPVGGSRSGFLKFKGKTRWCERDVNVDFFDIGVAFESLPDSDIAALEDLVKEFGFSE